jgi:hypothetical protein
MLAGLRSSARIRRRSGPLLVAFFLRLTVLERGGFMFAISVVRLL